MRPSVVASPSHRVAATDPAARSAPAARARGGASRRRTGRRSSRSAPSWQGVAPTRGGGWVVMTRPCRRTGLGRQARALLPDLRDLDPAQLPQLPRSRRFPNRLRGGLRDECREHLCAPRALLRHVRCRFRAPHQYRRRCPACAGGRGYAAVGDALTQRMPHGSVIKYHAVCDRPFRRDAGLSGEAAGDTPAVKVIYGATPPGVNQPGILLAFIEGADGLALSAATRQRVATRSPRCSRITSASRRVRRSRSWNVTGPRRNGRAVATARTCHRARGPRSALLCASRSVHSLGRSS